MREILFRGKRFDNGEWVQGYLTKMWGAFHIVDEHNENLAYSIDAETVGQFTGQKDKYQRKIFEGDIITATITSPSGKYTGTWEVAYNPNYCYFYLKRQSNNLLFDGNWSYGVIRIEIIGNIHDNPELLGGGANNGL